MKKLIFILILLAVFVRCKAQNELPKHSVKTVATKYLRGLSSGELNGDGIMRIPYNFGPSGNYRIQIGGDTGDTLLHLWIDQRIDEWFTAGGGFWLTGSNFAITNGVIASYETLTFSGDGSSFVYADNTLTATGTGTSGTTTLTIGGAGSPSFLVQANNEIRLQATSTGNVTVYNSGSRNDSTIVNEKRLQDVADTKEDVITGAVSNVVSSDLTADRAVISTSLGKLGVSPVTAAELAALIGIESNVQDQIDAIEAGGIADSADYWKRAGISLIEQDAEIRVTATNEIKIGKAAGSQLTFNDSYTLLGNLTDITGFFINAADSSASIISDSTGIRVKQNNVIEIVDERNDVGFRRHGIVGAADYSDAIRGTPKAYTQMQTVRDYTDSLVATLDFGVSVDTARIYDSLAVHRDSIDAISSYAHSLSQDYWPLSGNAATVGNQVFTLGGNLTFQMGGVNRFLISSSGYQNISPDGSSNFYSVTNSATTFTSQNGFSKAYTINSDGFNFNATSQDSIPLRFATSGSSGGRVYAKTGGSFSFRNLDGTAYAPIFVATPTANFHAATKAYVDAAVSGAGGVSEAYVAESVDSVRSEFNTNAILKASATYSTQNGADWILQKSTTDDEDLIIRKTGGGNGDLILSSTGNSELRATDDVIITTTGGNSTITANGVNNPNSRTDSTIVNEFRLQQVVGGLLADTLHIGGWDMDTDASKTIIFPNIHPSDIIDVRVIIYNDSETAGYLLLQPMNVGSCGIESGGVTYVVPCGNLGPLSINSPSNTNIPLHRVGGGFYDSTNFDDDTINRGHVLVTHF